MNQRFYTPTDTYPGLDSEPSLQPRQSMKIVKIRMSISNLASFCTSKAESWSRSRTKVYLSKRLLVIPDSFGETPLIANVP